MIIISEVKERIAYITLNRPGKKNALNGELVVALKEAIHAAAINPHVKVIVLKANGEVFCAGADLECLQQLQKNTFEENLQDSNSLKALFELIYFLPKIVIAQVEGHAIAGGCGLANVCDLVYTVPEAKFGYTEVRIGFIPALVMTFLIRKIGEGRAKELLLTGKLITANEAVTYQMVSQIFEKDTIAEKVEAIALSICRQNSAEAMATTKLMMAEIQNLSIKEALNYAATQNAKARGSVDCKKGIDAFVKKIKLLW
jgi:methylglutaconyl-CoA hydratase